MNRDKLISAAVMAGAALLLTVPYRIRKVRDGNGKLTELTLDSVLVDLTYRKKEGDVLPSLKIEAFGRKLDLDPDRD